jgi:carbon storage regulator
MLVLCRKLNEKIIIDHGITLTVLEVDGNRVKIGIDAPEDVRILRGELAERLKAQAVIDEWDEEHPASLALAAATC